MLLVTGIGWVDAMRDCLRTVWELPEGEENPLLRRVKDAGVLVGFGGAVLLTLAAPATATALVGWSADRLGLDGRAVGCIGIAHGWQATVTTLQALRSVVHALRGWPTPLGGAVNSAETHFEPGGECGDDKVATVLRTIGRQV